MLSRILLAAHCMERKVYLLVGSWEWRMDPHGSPYTPFQYYSSSIFFSIASYFNQKVSGCKTWGSVFWLEASGFSRATDSDPTPKNPSRGYRGPTLTPIIEQNLRSMTPPDATLAARFQALHCGSYSTPNRTRLDPKTLTV